MKGNRLTKKRKHNRDVKIIPLRGKVAKLVWIPTNEMLCEVNTETTRGLAYDLLKWAKETEKKFIRKTKQTSPNLTKKGADYYNDETIRNNTKS